MYFLAGCSIKMALKVLAGYAGGIVASIAIFELGDVLAGNAGLGGYWGYALAVLIVVVPVIAMERVPGFNFIPSWFIGAGVFFAFMGLKGLEHNAAVYANVAVPELAACVVGLVFGWITVTFRVWYEKKVATAA
jgi:energy-converting hydrogenase Eha subunit B